MINYTKPIHMFGEFSSFQLEFNSENESRGFIQKIEQLMSEEWCNETFLCNWYPNYYHADIIAINNDLACYAQNDWKTTSSAEDHTWAKEIEQEFDIHGLTKAEKLSKATKILKRFDKELYAEALKNYIEINNEWPTQNYKKASY